METKKYKIRKQVLNIPYKSWKIIDSTFLEDIFETDVIGFTNLIGTASFATAITNDEENEFIKELYEYYRKYTKRNH